MNYKFTHHHLAGSKKYGLSKTLKPTAKVALLKKDDETHFLTPNQRAELLAAVGEKYEEAIKPKKTRKPKIQGVQLDIREAAKTLTIEQILEGLKAGTITAKVG